MTTATLISRSLSIFTTRRVIILIALLALLISSGIIDPSKLYNGTGYEFPKVETIRIASIFIILCGSYLEFQKHFLTRLDKIFIVVSIFTAIFNLVFAINQNVSLFGNVFRNQGILLYLPVFLSLIVIYRIFESRHIKYLFLTILVASFMNAIRALLQFKDLMSDPEKFAKGFYVNGFFGQTNFFSTLMIFGVIAAAYFFGKKLHARNKLPYASLIVLFSVGTFLSLSRWGILTLVLAVSLIIIFELGFKRLLKYILILLYTLLIPGMVLAHYYYPGYEMHIDIWKKSFFAFIDAPIQNKVFGYGFDNLNNVFLSRNAFPGLNVDRAHSFILDTLTQLGAIGTMIFIAPIAISLRFLNRILGDRKLFFVFLAFTAFVVKTAVNEYSIANLYMFLIVSVALVKLVLNFEEDIEGSFEVKEEQK